MFKIFIKQVLDATANCLLPTANCSLPPENFNRDNINSHSPQCKNANLF